MLLQTTKLVDLYVSNLQNLPNKTCVQINNLITNLEAKSTIFEWILINCLYNGSH